MRACKQYPYEMWLGVSMTIWRRDGGVGISMLSEQASGVAYHREERAAANHGLKRKCSCWPSVTCSLEGGIFSQYNVPAANAASIHLSKREIRHETM